MIVYLITETEHIQCAKFPNKILQTHRWIHLGNSKIRIQLYVLIELCYDNVRKRNICLLTYRLPMPTFTTSTMDNFTRYNLQNYTLVATTIQSVIEQNYTLYHVNWSQMATAHGYLLFRINIWTYSFILKLVPSIILTVITGFLIKGNHCPIS